MDRELDLSAPGAAPDAIRRRFEARYVVAADTYGALAGPDELDEAWEAFADGRAAATYIDPTPESAVRARRLVASIGRLLDAPAPETWQWANRLRARVDQLATILSPVAASDVDPDDDPPWRTAFVDDVRARYPDAFTGPPATVDDED